MKFQACVAKRGWGAGMAFNRGAAAQKASHCSSSVMKWMHPKRTTSLGGDQHADADADFRGDDSAAPATRRGRKASGGGPRGRVVAAPPIAALALLAALLLCGSANTPTSAQFTFPYPPPAPIILNPPLPPFPPPSPPPPSPPPSPPPPPPTPEPIRNGIATAVLPRCALANGDTPVDVIATDAPHGNLTCRFIDYSVARGIYDAEASANVTGAAYEAASEAALNQAINVGFIPEEAAANNFTAYQEWVVSLNNLANVKYMAGAAPYRSLCS